MDQTFQWSHFLFSGSKFGITLLLERTQTPTLHDHEHHITATWSFFIGVVIKQTRSHEAFFNLSSTNGCNSWNKPQCAYLKFRPQLSLDRTRDSKIIMTTNDLQYFETMLRSMVIKRLNSKHFTSR